MSSTFCALRARLLLPGSKLPVSRLLALGLFSLVIIVAPQRIGELREAVAQAGIDAAASKVLLTQWLELLQHPSQLLDDMRRLFDGIPLDQVAVGEQQQHVGFRVGKRTDDMNAVAVAGVEQFFDV